MITLSIPDMSCGHCRASITEALGALPGIGGITFDAEARRADIAGPLPAAQLIAALDAIGFAASVVDPRRS